MIRSLFSAFVFLSTLLAGLALVRVAAILADDSVPFPVGREHRRTIDVSPFGSVEVTFLRWESFDGEPTAVFEVANRGVEIAGYWNYREKEAGAPEFALPRVRIGNEERTRGYCGTGLVRHRLLPGQSGTARVGGRFLAENWTEGRPLRIGYAFDFGGSRGSEIVWSAPLQIDAFVARELKKLRAQ